MIYNNYLNDSQLIISYLQKSLQLRNQEIIDQSHHYRSDNFELFKSYLCYIEIILFNNKHNIEKFIHNWKNDVVFDINTNFHISNKSKSILGKRKRSQI